MTRIAVIEDNEDNRLLIQALLADRFELVEFTDGVNLLPALRAAPPDLILMDISLPGRSGVDLLQEIRADQALSRVPVIALTAHAMAEDRDRLLELGFDEYVAKPIADEEVLLRTITTALEPRG